MAAHSAKRPQPLLSRASITAAISGLVSLLVTLGILPSTVGLQVDSTTGAVVTAVSAVMATVPTVVAAFAGRSVVTPVSDPRDNAGQKLVPAVPAPVPEPTAADEALARAEEAFPTL